MKQSIFTRGFTLIELLVVIAIIGILAAVVIGSLNDARSGGQDASIQQSVANVRAQAEMWYSSGSNLNQYSYTGLCARPAIDNLLSAAVDVVNGTDYVPATHGINTYQALNTVTGPASGRTASCHADETRYVAVAPLASNNGFWCVDSTGASKRITNAQSPAANIFVCP